MPRRDPLAVGRPGEADFAMVRRFPLRPIESDADLERADHPQRIA